MYTSIFIVIGIAFVIFLIYKLRKKPTDMPTSDAGKKEQFNPEKVSGMMPEEQKSDVKK